MNKQQDYIRDLAEIRSMMERSSKFLSLSGWAGIMAGIFALAGSWIAYSVFEFHPDEILYTPPNLANVLLLASTILVLALIGAILDSRRKAKNRGEKVWSPTSKRLLASMGVPLFAGGILILILTANGLIGLIAPLTLIFYGIALFNAGHYTIPEVRVMGVAQLTLGLMNAWYIEAGLIFWAAGFGVVHILYGIYVHFRYER